MPPSSAQRHEYWAPPAASLATSLLTRRWRNGSASGPEVLIWPMWETSNMPARSRTARCSAPTPSYWTGISHPANGTSRAPAATCSS